MKKHMMSTAMVIEEMKLIAESNKRYENWPFPFVVLSRISVLLCAFECSTTMWTIMGSSAVRGCIVSIVFIAAVCTPLIMSRATF